MENIQLPKTEPVEPPIKVSIQRYGRRHWALIADGELLAVTLFRKGAVTVKQKLEELSEACSKKGPESPSQETGPKTAVQETSNL